MHELKQRGEEWGGQEATGGRAPQGKGGKRKTTACRDDNGRACADENL